MQTNSKALEILIENQPLLKNKVRGLPDLGVNFNGGSFSNEVNKIYDVFHAYGNDLYRLENDNNINIPTRSLGGGSPMKSSAFLPAKRAMIDAINFEDMSQYPVAAGDKQAREDIVGYLEKEGFRNPNGMNPDNIIFTMSTTQAFNTIMKLIARPHDVVLMTGPNYGLFTFVPERSIGATVEILPLSEEDDWYVNSEKLSARIDEINLNLKRKYGDSLGYTPRVVAFFNENPHNPLGKVMNNTNREILDKIAEVCLEKGVFVIDDIIYRDLTFDRDNLALPMAYNEKYFDNTITLMGLSKSYGLASIRAGMIVANEAIIRGVRNSIFQTMDSSPILQAKAIAGSFNASKERYEEYDKYFNPLINEYKYRLELLKSMVRGLDTIEDKNIRKAIEEDVRKYASSEFNINHLLDGIPGVDFANKTIPDSGFFALLDFTKLKNKEFEGKVINNEIDLLEYMYQQEKIKLILGQSISWPNEDQIIGRVTTALEREDIVDHMGAMNKSLRKLK